MLSVFSCNNTNENTESSKELSLTRIEEFIDDQLVFEHTISYDSSEAIQIVTSESEVQTNTYSNQYENGELTSLELEIVNDDQTDNTVHDKQYTKDETILYERNRNRLLVIISECKFI